MPFPSDHLPLNRGGFRGQFFVTQKFGCIPLALDFLTNLQSRPRLSPFVRKSYTRNTLSHKLLTVFLFGLYLTDPYYRF